MAYADVNSPTVVDFKRIRLNLYCRLSDRRHLRSLLQGHFTEPDGLA